MPNRRTMTISLPEEMISDVERVRKIERRTRSELVREALRNYLAKRFPAVEATPREMAAIRRGRTEIDAGEYVTLDQLLHGLDNRPRKIRRKAG